MRTIGINMVALIYKEAQYIAETKNTPSSGNNA